MTDHLTETHKVMAEAIADPDSLVERCREAELREMKRSE